MIFPEGGSRRASFAAMLHWIYPEVCHRCGEATEGGSLCRACLAALPRVPRPICLHCGSPTDGGEEQADSCPFCEGKPRHLSLIRSALCYSESAIELVHELKYGGALHLAPALAPLLEELTRETPALKAHDDWAVVPIPIQGSKLRQRGFNQAEELARALAARCRGFRLLQALERRDTGTPSQTRLAAAGREHNARLAYHALPAYATGQCPLPPRLLLVDDVLTTGATLRACAAALKRCDRRVTVAAVTLLRM